MTARKPKGKKVRAKHAHKRRPYHSKSLKTVRRRSNNATSLQQAYSIEELLTKNIIDEQAERKTNPILPAVLYNLNAATKRLAYQQGYELGYKISAAAHGNSINTLLTALKNAGLGDMLYYPFSDMARISTLKQSPIAGIGMKMHSYEAGMISGFLSHALYRRINVTESKCIYNGDERCEFIASPSGHAFEPEDVNITATSLANIVNRLVASSASLGNANRSYVMLKLAPFTKQPLLNITASLLSSLSRGIKDRDVESIAHLLPGIEKVSVSRRKHMIRRLSVKYNREYSSRAYIAFSSPFILGASMGMLSRSSKDPKTAIKLNNDNTYTLEIKR